MSESAIPHGPAECGLNQFRVAAAFKVFRWTVSTNLQFVVPKIIDESSNTSKLS